VTRSTGINTEWPLLTASQRDLEFGIETIETDKVALSGYALLMLYTATDSITHPWVTPSLFVEVRPLLLNQVSQYSSLSLRISCSLRPTARPLCNLIGRWCPTKFVSSILVHYTSSLRATLLASTNWTTLSNLECSVAIEHVRPTLWFCCP
jgi:hypothetical protein